jgi:hypothetical protein
MRCTSSARGPAVPADRPTDKRRILGTLGGVVAAEPVGDGAMLLRQSDGTRCERSSGDRPYLLMLSDFSRSRGGTCQLEDRQLLKPRRIGMRSIRPSQSHVVVAGTKREH